MINFHQLLKDLVERGGSDLHITTNTSPQIRIDGKLTPMDIPPLTPVAVSYTHLTLPTN
jgi:twitching motility protein PilT